MSASEPMAVQAPSYDSGPVITASHAPEIQVPAHKGNGANGAKRAVGGGSGSSSSEDDKPLTKKPRVSTGGAIKKRRVVESDSDSDSGAAVTKPNGSGPSKSSVPVAVKAESSSAPKTNGSSKPRPKTPSDSEMSEDDAPLSAKKPKAKPAPRASINGNGNPRPKPKPKPKAKAKSASGSSQDSDSDGDDDSASFEDSEEERPLAKKKPAAAKPRASAASTASASSKPKPKPKPKKAKPASDSESDSSEDEKPLVKRKSTAAAAAPTPKKKVKQERDSSEDEKPLAKKKTVPAASNGKKIKVHEDLKPVVKKEKKVKDEEDEDEIYKWWEEQAKGDGSQKWKTLEHNGILFPPPYVPLPAGIKMKYDGVALTLPPESEEVAGFFAAMVETDHARDETFRANFFRDFQDMLKQYPPKENIRVKSLEKCDFKPMFEHFEAEKEKKKSMTTAEKKAIKEARAKLEEPYLMATVDGRKQKCGNFRAEPPGLFRGRGDHPRKGTLKHRLRPEDITLNIGKDAPVPVPNIGGNWKGLQHDNTVTWLATWKENVNKQIKYVFLAAGSAWKGQSDRIKFEKARELIKHIDKIRKDYTNDLSSKVMADRQRATAMYFIDRLALRAGNEKGEDEADTVGCCSLRYEHVTLEPPSKVVFDFLGKDSMRFHQEVEVSDQVFKNIKLFKKEPKDTGDDLFDRLNTGLLNKYLSSLMPSLSAKVFRTYNASWTFQQQLRNTPKNGTVAEKIAAYNTANRDVAILCNHQKTVSKGFNESFAKMGDKLRALKYQRMKLRYQLFTLEPKLKKKRPDLAADETDVDDEFIERHEADLLEKAIDGAKKKFERDNVKLEEEAKGQKKPKSELDERIKEIKAEFKELAKERKTKHVEPRRGATEEKLLEQIAKQDDRIATFRVQMGDRDKLKDVALGTSKINYIDPRLTVAWCSKYNVPIEKMFSKTLRDKFPWAEAEADSDWVF